MTSTTQDPFHDRDFGDGGAFRAMLSCVKSACDDEISRDDDAVNTLVLAVMEKANALPDNDVAKWLLLNCRNVLNDDEVTILEEKR
jgi:hypothetical protein